MPKTNVSTSGQALATNTETIVAVLPGISAQAGAQVNLTGEVDISAGTGTTGCTVSIRRGTTVAAPLVASIGPAPPAAAGRDTIPIQAVDSLPADVAGQQYIVTVTQAAATANGTANTATLRADY